jgi:Major intrinsic protein
MTASLPRRVTSEFFGTLFLVAAVVGSGIMGERLAGGNVALALLANTIATGAALVALILTFGPISGAHFNPAVTLAVELTTFGLSVQVSNVLNLTKSRRFSCPLTPHPSIRQPKTGILRLSTNKENESACIAPTARTLP